MALPTFMLMLPTCSELTGRVLEAYLCIVLVLTSQSNSFAEKVVVWLGPEYEDSDEGIYFPPLDGLPSRKSSYTYQAFKSGSSVSF